MRKILLLTAAVVLLAAASCKKNYRCYCSGTIATSDTTTAPYDTSFLIQAAGVGHAVDKCGSQTLGGGFTCVYN